MDRSQIMSRVPSRDTSIELKVRKFLFANGFRYRLHTRLEGKPDVVLPSRKVVIFVHGCFWHRHGCKRSTMPSSNKDYWDSKFKKNVARDRENTTNLKRDGWTIIVVWECGLLNQEKAKRTLQALLKNLLVQRSSPKVIFIPNHL